MAAHKHSLTHSEIDNILLESSDEEVDHLECENLYDCDDDADYEQEPSDSSDSDLDDEPPKKRRRKVVHSSPALHATAPIAGPAIATAPVAGPATATAPVAGPSTATAPVAGRGRRRRVPMPNADEVVVQFNSATIKSKKGFIWNTRPSAGAVRTPARNILQGFRPGPSPEASQANTPDSCFSLFITDEVIADLVMWTNQKVDIEALKYRQQKATVQRTSPDEMRAMLGLLIYSGFRKDNHLSTKDLWSPAYGSNFYRAVMSEGRFTFLLNCLRFDDVTTRAQRREQDRFAPIRRVWDLFIEACGTHYIPHEFLTVDEQLLAFRGHCPFRMYIPNKPAKYGIKIVMANDVKSKFMLSGIPYLGKQGNRPRDGQNLGHSFTKDLTQRYHNTHRNVTTDNWFTSVPLIQDLLHNCGMTLIGTVRGNKPEVPDEMKERTTRTPGSSAFLFTKDMTLVSYVPNTSSKKKVVLLMSSMHGDKSLGPSGKPTIIEDYNRTKGGVDTFDQMAAQYSCSRKTKRWPLCVFYGMLNAAVINSWIIHKENTYNTHGRWVQRKQYMQELATGLVKTWAVHRLANHTLPRKLREHICEVFEMPSDPGPSHVQHNVVADMREPITRCVICPSKADKKTRFRCVACQRAVCNKHYYSVCGSCV